MNLTFSRTYPKGHAKQYMQTYFEDRIKNGLKKHTFRFGHNWDNFKMIHFWMGNPRSSTADAKRFNLLEFPDKFSKDFSKEEGHVHEYCPLAHVEDFTVEFNPRDWENSVDFLTIEGRKVQEHELDSIAMHDGLLLDDFRQWMYLGAIGWMKQNGMRHEVKTKVQALGRIVHWDKIRYKLERLQIS